MVWLARTTRSIPTTPTPSRLERQDRPAGSGRRARLRGVRGLVFAPVSGLRLAHATCHPPQPERRHTPGRFKLDPEEIWISLPSSRVGRLSAWLCPGDPRRVVILGHGMWREKTTLLAHARFLHRAGFTVLLFDFRNHGDSFHDRSLTGFHRRFFEDVVAVVAHVRNMPEYARCRLVLYGISLASFAMLQAMCRPDTTVDAAVFDGGPAIDPAVVPGRLVRAGLLTLPRGVQEEPARSATTAVYGLFSRATLGTSVRAWPPPPDLHGVATTPMLLISGNADRVVPPAETQQLAQLYPQARTLYVPDAGHLQTMAMDRERYTTTVVDFLHRSLAEQEGNQG